MPGAAIFEYKNMSDLPPVVQIHNLSKRYGPIQAVDGITLEVRQGEIFGMLGPNGAGKTTTVEIIEGLRQADSGQVLVMGLNVLEAPQTIKQRIGIQLQAPSLLPLLTVEEMLDTFCGLFNRSLPVEEILQLVSLEESRKVLVKNLSGGQQQRLSVALALVNDPDIAFLDEPTTGLDPQSRRSLWESIEAMRDRDKTVFMTTHYMEEAERLCNRIAIIDHGKIIALDTPKQLISTHFREKAIQFEVDPAPDTTALTSLPGATNVSAHDTDVVIYSRDVPATMSALFKLTEKGGVPLKDLKVREATLEDVFIKLTGRKIRE